MKIFLKMDLGTDMCRNIFWIILAFIHSVTVSSISGCRERLADLSQTVWIQDQLAQNVQSGLGSPLSGFHRRGYPPRFRPTETNVTFVKGSLAILKCSVENLGTKTVIWRKQPYNVPITVGTEQFIELNRFYLNHIPHSDQWNLLIKNVQIHDSGTYECQISSKTKVLRRDITLNVIDRDTDRRGGGIVMNGTRFVEKGGELYLTCKASGTENPPDGIDWFKNGNMLTTKKRSDIHIQKQISISTRSIFSTLRIGNALMTDSGTYVCRTSDLSITRFKVDVLNAETYNVKRDFEQLSGIVTKMEDNSKSAAGSCRTFSMFLPIISCLMIVSQFPVTRR